uniref:Complexin-1 n=1 Tax=Oryctolagus cuniculus TaxID=9986 RepID=A0A5F9C1A1_RABIT
CPRRLERALGATKDMGKMLGGDEEKDPDAAKKEEERQEALRQEEEERKAKYAKMEAEREAMRQGIRDKVGTGRDMPQADAGLVLGAAGAAWGLSLWTPMHGTGAGTWSHGGSCHIWAGAPCEAGLSWGRPCGWGGGCFWGQGSSEPGFEVRPL